MRFAPILSISALTGLRCEKLFDLIHTSIDASKQRISTSILNEHHSTKLSLEYWQILIGPWLNTFITVLFDRWESITKAYKSLDRLQTLVLDFSEEKMKISFGKKKHFLFKLI